MRVLVVGGGPAGSTAARFLAKKFDVTLIQDKKDFDKPCGGGVKTKIFNQFNLDTNLIKHKLSHVYMVYKNKKIKIPLKGENLSIVLRKEFDKHLRELAQKEGVKLYYGKLKDIQNNTAIIKIDNLIFKFKFDILIAADGVNSTTRKILNLPLVPSTITHYATVNNKIDTCYFYFDKKVAGNFYAWTFPHNNQTHIGTVTKEEFQNLVKTLNLKINKIQGYKIPLWQEDIIYQKENIFFVGDAAGQVMPLSFEGIYYAMHSAKILADSIIKNLDYKEEWNERFLKEFRFLKKMQYFMANNLLRDLIINLQQIPFIKNSSVNLWLGK